MHLSAFELTKNTHDFLGEHGPSLRAELERQALGDKATAVEDALETLEWYHTQIPAKIYRALVDICRDDADDRQLTEFDLADADGSAKIAHLGLVRSMKALMVLQDCRPWLREQTMALMLRVADVLEATGQQFPGHKTFKRPVFDE